VVVIAALVALVAWPVGAEAGPAGVVATSPSGGHLNGRVSGDLSATGTWDFDESCGFVHEIFTGAYDPRRHGVGDGTFTLDLCVSGSATDWIVSGSFEVVTTGGVTLRGTAEGTYTITGTSGLPVDLALTVTESVGAPRPVRGTITVSGTRTEPGFMLSEMVGTFRARLR
jgi:hypothetical protein